MSHRQSKALFVSATAINAVLYALGALVTAYIESPWGHGQFRPAIVIPSVFSIIFGPWVGGIGAAIGTLIADSIKHGHLYLPSLIAAVPANFIAFFIFGKLLERKFDWTRFVYSSIICLLIGNLVCAILLVFYYTYIIPLFLPQFFIGLVFGLTAWWYITMIPFQLLLVPILVKAVVSAYPSLVRREVFEASLKKELPTVQFSLALIIPGLLMLIFGIITLLYPSVAYSMVGILRKASVIVSLIQFMFLVTGSGALILGLGLLVAYEVRKRRSRRKEIY